MEGINDIERFNKLEAEIDALYDAQARKVYQGIIDMGERAFNVNGPLYKYKDSDLIDLLIEHFQGTEEYEKCSELQEISWRLKGI